MKLSQRQYITRSGTHCPVCGKQVVESEPAQLTENPVGLERPSKCTNSKCGATWLETYTMTGYTCVKNREGELIELKEP